MSVLYITLFCLDVTSSMRSNFERAKTCIKEISQAFLESKAPHKIGLMTFSEKQNLVPPGFFEIMSEVKNDFDKRVEEIRVDGFMVGTALYDAIIEALKTLKINIVNNQKEFQLIKANLIIITDGKDNASKAKREDLKVNFKIDQFSIIEYFLSLTLEADNAGKEMQEQNPQQILILSNVSKPFNEIVDHHKKQVEADKEAAKKEAAKKEAAKKEVANKVDKEIEITKEMQQKAIIGTSEFTDKLIEKTTNNAAEAKKFIDDLKFNAEKFDQNCVKLDQYINQYNAKNNELKKAVEDATSQLEKQKKQLETLQENLTVVSKQMKSKTVEYVIPGVIAKFDMNEAEGRLKILIGKIEMKENEIKEVAEKLKSTQENEKELESILSLIEETNKILSFKENVHKAEEAVLQDMNFLKNSITNLQLISIDVQKILPDPLDDHLIDNLSKKVQEGKDIEIKSSDSLKKISQKQNLVGKTRKASDDLVVEWDHVDLLKQS